MSATSADAETPRPGLPPEKVVNTDRYPIAGLADPRVSALVAELKAHLDAHQYVVLDDFIRPEARALAVEQALAARHKAHPINSRRNVYLQRVGDPALPADHPRNILSEASTHMLAYDLLPEESPLKILYHWEATKRLVAGIVGVGRLYDNADPLQPVNTLCYEEGDQSSWHFDSVNAFTMTLMLQAPEAGGTFQMVPNTRSDDDQNEAYVGAVVRGERDQDIVEVGRSEGALCIFRGCNSAHRVSPVLGNRMRLMGVFVYETEPGVVGDPEVNETVYGRRTAA